MKKIALFLALFLSLVPFIAMAQILHWPMLGGNPLHEGEASAIPQSPLEQTWRKSLGIPTYSAPLTDGSKIYLSCGTRIDDSGAFFCLDPQDGRVVFRHDFAKGMPQTPVLSGGRIIGACADGHIYGRDISGSEVYSTLIEGKGSRSSGVDNATMVIFGTTGSKNNLVCVDAYTGNTNWTAAIASDIQTAPVAYGGLIYVLADDNNLYAVNDSNGNIEWKWEVGSSPSAAPMIFDNHLLIPSSSGISSLHLAFEYKDLKVSWTRDDIGKVTTMPCTDGINIFFGTDSGKLYCLNGANGNQDWEYNASSRVTCSPVVASGKVVFGCEDGNVTILDSENGKFVEKIALGAIPTAQPLVFWDRIIVSCSTGEVVCLGPKGEGGGGGEVIVDPEPKTPILKIDCPQSAFVGQKVKIPILIEDAQNITGLKFTFAFDQSSIKYTGYEPGQFFSHDGSNPETTSQEGDGEVVFGIGPAYPASGKGMILELEIEPLVPGKHGLTLIDATATAEGDVTYEPLIVSDTLEVKLPRPEVEVLLDPALIDHGKITGKTSFKLRLTQKNGELADFIARGSSEACAVFPDSGTIGGNNGIDIIATVDPAKLPKGPSEVVVSVNIIGKTLKSVIKVIVPEEELPGTPPPCIKVDPIALDFGFIPRGREVSIDFTLTFDTDKEISGVIKTDKRWLRVTPATFKTKGGEVTGIATIAASELPGVSSVLGYMTISAQGKICQDVRVEARVETQPSIVLELDIGVKRASIGSIKVDLDQAPRIRNERTLVPIRFVSESFGCKVQWEATTKKVTINRFDDTIILWIGKKEAIVNGKMVSLDVAPSIEEGGTLVPIRFISQAFGASVEWFHETKHIRITYTPPDDYVF
ncbi:MAG: PQQ-binding-like beta-propeller repeat protein [Caldisericia bacterium]|nr:PQQ-binding-like beta-propeller repeat protein [Caldisericia bacterium]